jgi:hypothetical protein
VRQEEDREDSNYSLDLVKKAGVAVAMSRR